MKNSYTMLETPGEICRYPASLPVMKWMMFLSLSSSWKVHIHSFICARILNELLPSCIQFIKVGIAFFIHTFIHLLLNKYFLVFCYSVRTVLGTVHLLMDKINMFFTILFVNYTSRKLGMGEINMFASLMEFTGKSSTVLCDF